MKVERAMKLVFVLLALFSSLFFVGCGQGGCTAESDCDPDETCGYYDGSETTICYRIPTGGGGKKDSGTPVEEDSAVAEPPKPILTGWSVSSEFAGVSDPSAVINSDGTGTLTLTTSAGALPTTLNVTVEYAADGAPMTLTSVEQVGDRQYVVDILYEDSEFEGIQINHGLPVFDVRGFAAGESVHYTDHVVDLVLIFFDEITRASDGSEVRGAKGNSYISFSFRVPPPPDSGVDAAVPPPSDAGVDSAQPPPPPCTSTRVVDFSTSPVFPGASPVSGTVDFANQTGSFNFDGNQDSGSLVIDPVFHRPTSITGTNFLVFFGHRPAGQLEDIRVFYNVQGGEHSVGDAWKITNLIDPTAQLFNYWYPDSNSEGTVTRDGNTITVSFPAGTFTVHLACTTP